MSANLISAIMAVYPNRGLADAAVTYVQQLEASGDVDVDSMAVITKGVSGLVAIDVVDQFTQKKGLRRGALIGAVIGIAFPPSLLATSILGAGLGKLAGRLAERSADLPDMTRFEQMLPPGHAGILVLGSIQTIDIVEARLSSSLSVHRELLDTATLTALVDDTDESGDGGGKAAI